jgi:DNA-binding protein YbaB
MAFDPLPTPASLQNAILTIERQLGALEAQLRAKTFNGASADQKLKATVNGAIEVVSIFIDDSLKTDANLAALGTNLVPVVNQAINAAHAQSAVDVKTGATAFNLLNICTPTGTYPNFVGFADAAAALTAEKPAIDARIAAKQFQGQAGDVTAIVNGMLNVVSIVIARLPDHLPVLDTDVADAINRALAGGKPLIDTTVGTIIDTVNTNVIAFPEICLYAHGNMQIADRVKVKKQDGTFAPVVNAGTVQTNVGADDQVGDVWSRAPVVLRDRARVTGSVRAMSGVTRQSNTVVTGTVIDNGFIQVPNLSLSVTFPGTNQGNKSVPPNGTLTLAPGAYADVTVNAGATLFLSGGTYFFNNFDVEPGAKLSCTSQTTRVTVNVKLGFIFRGSIIEKNSTARPKFFLACFGTSLVPIEAPYTGTLVALDAPVKLGTVGAPGHTGAFYVKDLTVDPDNTIVHFPFSGPPSLGTF